MELRHLLDEGVWDRVSHLVTLDVLWVRFRENLELLLDQLGSLELLALSRGQHMLCFRPFALLSLEGGLSEN